MEQMSNYLKKEAKREYGFKWRLANTEKVKKYNITHKDYQISRIYISRKFNIEDWIVGGFKWRFVKEQEIFDSSDYEYIEKMNNLINN